jgi:hypothetical protein
MEVNTMEKGEINDVVWEEVVMEDMDYAKELSNRRRGLREKQDSELSSDEEVRAQFSTVRTRRKQNKAKNDGVNRAVNSVAFSPKVDRGTAACRRN